MNLQLWPSSQNQSTLCWIQLQMTLLLLMSPCGKSCICRRLSPNWFSVPRKTQHPRAGGYARSEEVDNTTGSHSPCRTSIYNQQNRALRRNIGNKVICEPPIKELYDHPSIIASPHICTSNSTIQRVVPKTFPWKNVHGRDDVNTCEEVITQYSGL